MTTSATKASPTTQSGGHENVQAIRRAVKLLQVLAEQPNEPPLNTVKSLACLPLTTTHRLLLTLAEDGLVTALPNGRYRLGPELARLGSAAIAQASPGPALHDLLRAACAATNETIGLLEVVDDTVTVIDKVESPEPLRYNLGIGTRLPAHCTASGKVLLAFASSSLQQRLLASGLQRRTAATVTTRDDLTANLAVIRDRGYASDREEYREGLCCIAMPVRDFSGAVTYALAASGPTQRFTDRRLPDLLAALRETAQALEGVLGFRRLDGLA